MTRLPAGREFRPREFIQATIPAAPFFDGLANQMNTQWPMIQQFEYFAGPDADMAHFVGVASCSLCGNTGPCFAMKYASSPEVSDDERSGKVGCGACLREGRFEFWHDTEIGLLSATGLEHVYNHNKEPPSDFSSEALTQLRRTPRIVTWQQEIWLTHCLDFMTYQGTWEPIDFTKNSVDGDGRALFLEMTDEYPELWDEAIEDGESQPAEWHATYYVFRCRHCGTLRGNYDFD